MVTLKILVVEDEKTWRGILQDKIHQAIEKSTSPRPHEIQVVDNYDEARTCLSGKDDLPHLLFTDMSLGKHASQARLGEDLLERANERKIPAILVSETPDLTKDDVAEMMGDNKIRHYFGKRTFDAKRFFKAVQKTIEEIVEPDNVPEPTGLTVRDAEIERQAQEIAELKEDLERFDQKDRSKTAEINILVKENNALKRELAQAMSDLCIPEPQGGEKQWPKIFISHRHKDEDIVRSLLDCIELYFNVKEQHIRCTSVRPYRLEVGENTPDRLRDEISHAAVVLGILTGDTLESSYVAFELGSAWGQRKWLCPLLARGANQSHIPGPIHGLSPLFLSKPGDCYQLLDNLKDRLTDLGKRKVNSGVLSDKVGKLVEAAGKAQN